MQSLADNTWNDADGDFQVREERKRERRGEEREEKRREQKDRRGLGYERRIA